MGSDLFSGSTKREYFAVDSRLANASGYELCILRSKVEYDDRFVMIRGGQER
jgi:hypothetical protein